MVQRKMVQNKVSENNGLLPEVETWTMKYIKKIVIQRFGGRRRAFHAG